MWNRFLIAALLVLPATLARAQGGPGQSNYPVSALVLQQNGTTEGTVNGNVTINFVSGCTVSTSGSVASITCTGGSAPTGVSPIAVTSGAISLQNSTPANVTTAYGTDTGYYTGSGGPSISGDVMCGDANGGIKDCGFPGYPLAFGSGAAVSNSTTDYVSIGHMSGSATTDSINVPRNGTISNLFCRDSGSITAGTGTVVLTAYYNSTAEALTCTLNNTNQNACSDTTAGHAFSVVAGNALAIQSVPTAGSSTITGGIVNCTVVYQ